MILKKQIQKILRAKNQDQQIAYMTEFIHLYQQNPDENFYKLYEATCKAMNTQQTLQTFKNK